ncbi:hypothetical protein NBRC10512_001848 [Rhodotorula toruloides]|uniref:RHTO0S19e01134g1_1 n=2 Tax=Rhodotorula toruloides TaxID=5286 RepID=A0A061BFA7_RHOTO|nr:protein of Conidiation-specific protein 6 family [Rhodotorula toruloides NP11]EMS20182.1 protein of Conidiation-specific protein 6 family [Rhodotorula toruloides NP11]CDR48630.1 RHTO0S19e01134g1_1 [Rhodotorula toruloides]
MTHELQVEGDKVVERDEQGNVISEKDYAHVIRGYKAATHNPPVSSEHKKEAAEILHDLEKAHGDAPEASAGASTSPKHHGEGHKGRPHIEKHVAEGGEHEHGHAKAATGSSGPGSSAAHEEEVHRHRVIGGLKANLHRDDRSEETKESIREKLHEMGEEAD